MSAAAVLRSAIPKLGVGLPYLRPLPPEIYRSGLIDFVEMTPETICRQRPSVRRTVLEILPDQLERARHTCGALPLAVHGAELSIGSARGWNDAYLDMLDEFQSRWPFVWHSEHLGLQTIPCAVRETGTPPALPPTMETAEIVARRSLAIQYRYRVPFLLENPACDLPDPSVDSEMADEIGLLRAITQSSGCFQLLDLHNVYCNAINNAIDPLAAIDRMPLGAVAAIHVAGGSGSRRAWDDTQDGRVPEAVWELLEYALPRCHLAGGVVFRMADSHAWRLGAGVIREQLARARGIWERFN